MEGNASPISFSEFNKEYTECLKIQEWKEVNNQPLATLLKNHPEKFFEYLMEILFEDHAYKSKNQAILIMKSLLQNNERLQLLSISLKTKIFGFLFDLMMKISNQPDLFAIFNLIGEIFSGIYLKFPAEQSFLPKDILNHLNNYKNIDEGPLLKIVLFFISKILSANSGGSHSNLVEINDFVIIDWETLIDPFLMASYLNVCICLYKSEICAEHNPQLLENIMTILNKILEIEECKNCPRIMEEFFGYFMNLLSEAPPSLTIPNNDLICKVLTFQKTASLQMRKTLSIFLTSCTNSNIFILNDDLLHQIFEVFLQTLADSIPDPDEIWLQDISFDKMSSEQNNICDYESLAHFHFISMILYSNLADDISLHNLKKFSATTNWKMVCALLTAVTNLITYSDIETMFQVFPYIFSCQNYVNPKVRLTLLKLIEELSIEFGKEFYKKTHKAQESKILALLDDSIPRIRIMATFSIISFLNDIPKKDSRKKLQLFIPKIKESIDAKCYYFIPEILSLASEFVHQLDAEANDFAQDLIPVVLSLKAEGLPPAEEANFYGKIMEFISIFIQAINLPALVNPHKDQILNLLLVNQGKIKNAITLNEIYLLDAWERMALIYRKEIQNYLAVVIGKMIPLGIKYMKDKEELREINEVFKGGFPRIYHTEVNRDQEVIKNLGEILKIFLENSEHDAIKNYETIILFLNTSYKNIFSSLKVKKDKLLEVPEEEIEDENIFYEDFYYFYKDLVSCGFLFLQHYSHKASSEEFLSAYRRLNHALWQIIENNPQNDKPLIKLLYTTFESIKFSLLELPKESFSNHDLNQFLTKLKDQWYRVINIDFEAYAGEPEEEDEESEEEQFVDLRIDMYFVIHEIITNLLIILSEDQREVLTNSIFNPMYMNYLDDYLPKTELTEIEDDILSSILFSLVEILQEFSPEFIEQFLPWKKILENLIKYSTYHEDLIRHNSCYALGLFHEKVELHHDMFPQILNYVATTIENLEKATEFKSEINPEPKTNNQNNEHDSNSATGPAQQNSSGKEDFESISEDEDLDLDIWECMDNVYSSIGRMIKVYFGNNEFIKSDLITKYLKYLPLKHDREEGKDQHEILLKILLKSWNEILKLNEENYGEIMRIMGELCLEVNEDISDLKTKKKIKKLCNVFKTDNASKFTKEMNKMNVEQKKGLEECLNNKDLDED